MVFDRDEHKSYHAALAQAAAQSGKLRNDNVRRCQAEPWPRCPCFELWRLLHFEDVQAPHYTDMMRWAAEVHLPGYEKGGGSHWHATQARLDDATARAITWLRSLTP